MVADRQVESRFCSNTACPAEDYRQQR